MLTIFTIPKAFHGHIKIIQTNAIQSWVLLRPKCEVILLGNDAGTAELASELGIRHVPDVEYSEHGTPLVSSTFNIAQDIASHQVMCYVNADIIFINDFLPAVYRVHKKQFLVVGQRWDLEMKKSVNFNEAQWEAQLKTNLAENGKLHPKSGIDYFVFPRGLYTDVPPFAVGRGGWDNWLIYRARSLNVPVIDATKTITAIHQNHDYSHVPGGKDTVWQGPETHRNINLLGRRRQSFTLEYVTFLLTPQGLRPALTPRYLYFRMRAIPILYPGFHFLLAPFKVFEKFVRVVRSIIAQL